MTDKEKLEQISLSLEKFQRVSHLKDFPRIEKKGSHPRFPRDAVVEWMRENWREL